MTNKERFLIDNVGFHYEDLNLIRQAELESIIKELGVSKEWMLLALSRDTVDNWNKWGFALFRKADFRNTINNLEQAIDKMSEEKFEKENNRKNAKNPQLCVDEETFRKKWDEVKQQGCLYTAEDAEARGLTSYWTYNHALDSSRYQDVNMMIAQESLNEEDWAVFVLSIQKVKIIGIEK